MRRIVTHSRVVVTCMAVMTTLLILPMGNALAASHPQKQPSTVLSLNGIWHSFSSYFYYDAGGGGGGAGGGAALRMNGNHWYYGTSSGTFKVAPITAADWKHWGIQPYGPTKKIIWSHWGKQGTADGPIETERIKGRLHVDFLWVIYHENPPIVQYPGTVWLKFGH